MAIAEMAATVAIAITALIIAAIVTETEGAAEEEEVEMLDELEEEEEEECAYCVLMMGSLQWLYRVGEGRRIHGRGESDR